MSFFDSRRIACIVCFSLIAACAAPAHGEERAPATVTPIEHVIVILGENRSFDHLFGTYRPPKGETVANLLSKGIVDAQGRPGPNFDLAKQFEGELRAPAKFALTPTAKTPYPTLPAPLTGAAHQAASDGDPPPFATLVAARAAEGAELNDADLPLLMKGGTGLARKIVDTRIADVERLPSGPFRLTPGVPYDAYAGNPVHRFYQNWQQLDCSIAHARKDNPSGCLSDLFAWVEASVGGGADGAPRPTSFDDRTTGEGAAAMAFYDVETGDMPYFAELARSFAMSDNFHQSVMGGTGANSIMIGAADLFYYTDGRGAATKPPADQIENPDARSGTNNWYTQDGYKGGSYSDCSDPAQPGVGAVLSYLASLPYRPNPNCAPGTYYLLNNYAPGYRGDGSLTADTPFTLPPSPVLTIADRLLEKGVSWKFYGESWNAFLADPKKNVYCDICNPFLYETAIMTDAAIRSAHLKDTADLRADIARGDLPAVSFVKPGWRLDGHPTSSTFALFEAFARKLVDAVRADPKLWAKTAIFVTVDEGGGYYDSGYVQPLDFFGDGVRIPFIVVSPFSTGGRIVHAYYDHVSMLKFIERNWRLPTISARSRDNLPNPIHDPANPYVPVNSPAIGDLFEMFDFGPKRD